ncbi:MAG: helix-turn-helix domain-containing protein [Bilophila sp.]
MSFFQEVYNRIRCATNARTQTELAAVLEIRQSSISDAKRRDSVPADWYMKLFEKFGLNPDWLKNGTGPMFLRIDQVYTPVEAPPGGLKEDPAHYADPTAISVLSTVYATQCPYEEGNPAPDLQPLGKIALPQSYVTPQTLVFHIESDALAPLVHRGAHVGVDSSCTHPISGEVYAVLMPHEGVALKRLFLDNDTKCFQLRTEQPGHPAAFLPAQDCPQRLLGRVSWVLQQI